MPNWWHQREITGSLAVITDPPGAEIFVDGDFKGVSPVTIRRTFGGTHAILLTLGVPANTTTNISITAGKTQKYTDGNAKGIQAICNRPAPGSGCYYNDSRNRPGQLCFRKDSKTDNKK